MRRARALTLLAMLLGAQPSLQAQPACTKADFEAVVDDAAAALRELNATNKPIFQEKLRQLKEKRGWSHDKFMAEAAPFVQDERIAAGKPAIGTIRFTGEGRGDWLRVTCEDDGRGVDVESMQKLASRPLEDDEDVLSLLFLPGLTTRASADFLAGRGVGLDLALSVVRRLGGTLGLSRGRPSGITATIEASSGRGINSA